MPIPSESTIALRIRPAVRRDLLRRGENVKRVAQANLRGAGGAPRRVNTGRLLRAIEVTPNFAVAVSLAEDAVQIGVRGVHYVTWVTRGTGIYGPHRQRIVPRMKKALRFYYKPAGRVLVVRSVKGMRPNNFLVDAMPAARH